VSAREAVLDVVVQPRSSRNAVTLQEDGSIRVWVTRPPADGEANRAVLGALARALGCPPSTLELVAGARGRRKRIRTLGLSVADVRERLSSRP
jgi:hypothetical protein